MDQNSTYSFSEAKAKLEAYCAYQDRCTFEIEQKIFSWGLSDKDRSTLLSFLREHNYLSDERFVASFISGKIGIKRWGRLKIVNQLKLKRIPSQLITQGMEGVEDSVYFENLKFLCERKLSEVKPTTDDYTKKAKVFRYLQSKGYTLDEISDVYSNVIRSFSC